MSTQGISERFVSNLQQVVRDAENLLQTTASETEEKAMGVRRRLGRALKSAKDACDRFQDKATLTADAADHAVHKHPYPIIGLALGVGLLIGVLTRRR